MLNMRCLDFPPLTICKRWVILEIFDRRKFGLLILSVSTHDHRSAILSKKSTENRNKVPSLMRNSACLWLSAEFDVCWDHFSVSSERISSRYDHQGYSAFERRKRLCPIHICMYRVAQKSKLLILAVDEINASQTRVSFAKFIPKLVEKMFANQFPCTPAFFNPQIFY